VAKNGDMRGDDRLKAAEYATMTMPKCDAKFPDETIAKFRKMVESLRLKQKNFVTEHKEIGNAKKQNKSEHLIKMIESRFVEGAGHRAVEKHGTLVIASKRLFMDIFLAEGEAEFLDIFDFMELPAWKELKCIFELSKIQSASLDHIVNEDIWKDHLSNRKNKMAAGLHHVVIEGAGPNGLLAAFQLFRAGMDIALVNDRVDYTRPQMVMFDHNWMCSFRYFLGTKFNQIFHSPGLINDEHGFIGIRFAEQAMKKRLEQLAEFVREKKNCNSVGCLGSLMGKKEVGGTLDLLYGYKVDGLEAAPTTEDKNIYAKLIKNGQDGELTKRIPVDLFLCMGGANDQLREHLLGMI
jgi:hypothetical protein